VKVQLLLRLFPRQWHARYAEEFSALLENVPISLAVVIDIALAAIKARVTDIVLATPTRRPGGGQLFAARNPAVSSVVALALLLPAIVVMGLFALKFKLGVAEPFDTVWYAAGWIRPFQFVVVLAPLVSLLLTARRIIDVSVRQDGNGLAMQIAARSSRSDLLLILTGVTVLVLLQRYFFAQHLVDVRFAAPWPWFPPPWEW
jgi:hypothetical protein